MRCCHLLLSTLQFGQKKHSLFLSSSFPQPFHSPLPPPPSSLLFPARCSSTLPLHPSIHPSHTSLPQPQQQGFLSHICLLRCCRTSTLTNIAFSLLFSRFLTLLPSISLFSFSLSRPVSSVKKKLALTNTLLPVRCPPLPCSSFVLTSSDRVAVGQVQEILIPKVFRGGIPVAVGVKTFKTSRPFLIIFALMMMLTDLFLCVGGSFLLIIFALMMMLTDFFFTGPQDLLVSSFFFPFPLIPPWQECIRDRSSRTPPPTTR